MKGKITAIAAIVTALAACHPTHYERVETVYRTEPAPVVVTAPAPVTDDAIVSRLRTRIMSAPELSGSNITISSYDGVVTLRGAVRTGYQADQAIRIARETPGVREVAPALTVQ